MRVLALLVSPFCYAIGYGRCYRCKLSCRFLGEFHFTPYSASGSCFPLCEHCWRKLGTPQRRLPYYERLVLGLWADDAAAKWPGVMTAVLDGR